jgi:AcrR family transcriptional regulator
MLAEEGRVDALSLRAIAREVGVATTSIYLHFRDLDELVTGVKELRFDELQRSLEKAADRAGTDPYERLCAIAHEYVKYALHNAGHYSVLFTTSATSLPSDPNQRFIGEGAFDAIRDDVAAVVGEDDAWLVTVHLWTALHGLTMLRIRRRKFPWPPVREQVDDLLHRLLGQ